ncbi:Carotenoid cis-trans isomerase [hydrothermal vent metagenome]|uniref:Carotenoid cis-trans isomerase n=1 Tax=hydrothermal vent metagenome TaxID=652676 RepID=A0A1W1EEC0_9ZZZZ
MKKISIIGAGLGGLTAGALLAKNGHKVTLLEQHNIVGGCATTFNRKGGFICEVGLHEMEGVYSNPYVKDIFEELDVYNNVTFVKPDEFFEVTTSKGSFSMPDGIDNASAALKERFPDSKDSIDEYFNLIQRIDREFMLLQGASWYHYMLFPFFFPSVLKYKNKTVSEVLDGMIDNEELKLILNINVQYYNDTPKTLSFLLHAFAQHSYFHGGGWFIKGGSQKLSDYLASVIESNGGEVITKAMVTACENNKVTYVKRKESHSVDSDIVISNISPEQTYDLYNLPYEQNKEIASGLLTIYIGFSKNIRATYGKRAYSNFIFDNLASMQDYEEMIQKDIEERGFVFVDYSQLDAALTKDENKSFGAICLMDYIEEWEKLDEKAYEEKKERLIELTLEKLEQYYPNITALVEYAEVGTAKTVKRYIKTPKGTAYGYKPTPKQFFKAPKVKSSKINNLYFTGQWVISGGFSPAILSGGLCYTEISAKK